MDDNKKKALAAALGQIEKQFGKGSVMRMGDAGPSRDIDTISTRVVGLLKKPPRLADILALLSVVARNSAPVISDEK